MLIHGFPLDGGVWAKLAPLLQGHRVIVPDLRGFGRSAPTGPFTISDLADDVAGVLDALKVASADIVGLSMGGYVAQELLRVAPHRIDRLILIDTKPDADTTEAQNKRNAMATLAKDQGAEAIADTMLPNMLAPDAPADVKAALRRIMMEQPPATLEHACIAMRDREDFVDLLMHADHPIGLIVGEHDAITPPTLMESIHGKLRFGDFYVINNAGHMSPFEQPQAVADAILHMTRREK